MLPCKKWDNVKTLEGISGIVCAYVRPLVMPFMVFIIYLAVNVVSIFNLRTLSYGNSGEVQEVFSNLLGETHKNVVLHIRKQRLHPKVSWP